MPSRPAPPSGPALQLAGGSLADSLTSRCQIGHRYRLRTLSRPDGTALYVAILKNRENKPGIAALHLAAEDQKDAEILEFTRSNVEGVAGVFTLEADNYPLPAGKSVTGQTPGLQIHDDGWITIQYRDRFSADRGHFVLAPPQADHSGPGEAVSLKSRWHTRSGHFLRHINRNLRVSPATDDDPAFPSEATWVFEQVAAPAGHVQRDTASSGGPSLGDQLAALAAAGDATWEGDWKGAGGDNQPTTRATLTMKGATDFVYTCAGQSHGLQGRISHSGASPTGALNVNLDLPNGDHLRFEWKSAEEIEGQFWKKETKDGRTRNNTPLATARMMKAAK